VKYFAVMVKDEDADDLIEELEQGPWEVYVKQVVIDQIEFSEVEKLS